MVFSKIVWFSLRCFSDLLQELLKVQSGKVVLLNEQVSMHDTMIVLAEKQRVSYQQKHLKGHRQV